MQRTVAVFLTALLAISYTQAQGLYAVDGGNVLYSFNSSDAAPSIGRVGALTGFIANDRILALTAAPTATTGTAFIGLTNANAIYRVFPANLTVAFLQTITGCNLTKANPARAIDYDPISGNLTIVTIVGDGGSNFYNVDISSGSCTTYSALPGTGAGLVPFGIGYRYNPGSLVAPVTADTSTLFLLNAQAGGGNATLHTVNPPFNQSTLSLVGTTPNAFPSGVGALTVRYSGANGATVTAFAAIYSNNATTSGVYTIDLTNANTSIVNLTSINLVALVASDSVFPSRFRVFNPTIVAPQQPPQPLPASSTTTTTAAGAGASSTTTTTAGTPSTVPVVSFATQITLPGSTFLATITPQQATSYTTTVQGSASTQVVTVLAPSGGQSTYTANVNVGYTPFNGNAFPVTQTQGTVAVGNGVTETINPNVPLVVGNNLISRSFAVPVSAQYQPAANLGQAIIQARDAAGNTFTRLATIVFSSINQLQLPTLGTSQITATQTAVATYTDNNNNVGTIGVTLALNPAAVNYTNPFTGDAKAAVSCTFGLVAFTLAMFVF